MLDSLADLLAGPVRSRAFRVDEILAGTELKPDDLDTFARAVRDPLVKPSRLEAAMAAKHVRVSVCAINNWRRSNGVTR